MGEIPTANILKNKTRVFTKVGSTYRGGKKKGGEEERTELQNYVKSLYNKRFEILANPMQLKEDLLFKPYCPKLKAHHLPFEDLCISKVPDFPS